MTSEIEQKVDKIIHTLEDENMKYEFTYYSNAEVAIGYTFKQEFKKSKEGLM